MQRLDRRQLVLGAGAAALAARSSVSAPVVRFDDPAFEAVIAPDAVPRTVFRGGRWCEGPCWVPALDGLVFGDVRANRMWLLREGAEPVVFRDPSDNANGSVLDADGRLVTCEHRTRRVVRTAADGGGLAVLADRFDGKRLNSPNDAALGPDGAIWFTDPTYGITQPDEGIMATPEQSARRVYRIDPSGRLEAMTDAVDQPNGIAVAADGRTLYVTETGASRNPEGASAILAFAVRSDGTLGEKRTLVPYASGVPDGLALDTEGRLYAASPDGVRVFAPDGRMLGRIATAGTCGNLAFGGRDGRRLFIAAGDVVEVVDLKVPGIEWLKR